MIFKSPVFSQASGSIAGITYSHNKGGMYTRARSIPTNPNTQNQTEVRNALTQLAVAWSTDLNATQRSGWQTWAANTPFTNALGDPINLSGQQAFIGANTGRLQVNAKFGFGMVVVKTPPVIFNRGDFTTPSFVASEASGIDVTFDDTDAWANENGAVMIMQVGRPQSAGRLFFKGPWRAAPPIQGNSSTPPTSPRTIMPAALAVNVYPIAEGQNVWMRFTVSRIDGRFSSGRIVGPVTVTA